MNKHFLDETDQFLPKYDDNGLVTCVTVSHADNAVLMVAYMNKESLELTLETGEMHYWSRSRQSLWHKGATSGDVQKVINLKVDCDQDCLLAVVEADKACHTGRRSCFYRSISNDGKSLSFNDRGHDCENDLCDQ